MMLAKPKTVAVLEVMWDWRMKTSATNPNYLAEAPRAFRINPENHSGKRLYQLLGHDNLMVTNACPQLVTGAKGKGNPDAYWLLENLEQLWPYSLLLVCGKVAQETYDLVRNVNDARTLYLPHPAARQWSRRDMVFATRVVQDSVADLELLFTGGRLRAKPLPPF